MFFIKPKPYNIFLPSILSFYINNNLSSQIIIGNDRNNKSHRYLIHSEKVKENFSSHTLNVYINDNSINNIIRANGNITKKKIIVKGLKMLYTYKTFIRGSNQFEVNYIKNIKIYRIFAIPYKRIPLNFTSYNLNIIILSNYNYIYKYIEGEIKLSYSFNIPYGYDIYLYRNIVENRFINNRAYQIDENSNTIYKKGYEIMKSILIDINTYHDYKPLDNINVVENTLSRSDGFDVRIITSDKDNILIELIEKQTKKKHIINVRINRNIKIIDI